MRDFTRVDVIASKPVKIDNVNKTVNIMGFTYKIVMSDKVEMDDNTGYAGKILYQNQEIHVKDGVHKQYRFATLMHEVIHGLLYHFGVSEHDEESIDMIANGMASFIINNKDLLNEWTA